LQRDKVLFLFIKSRTFYGTYYNSFDPAKLFKAMRTFNISNHRSIDSSSFSPQMSNFALFLVLPFIPQQLVLIFIGVPIAKLPL